MIDKHNHLKDPDGLYNQLVDAYESLDEEQAEQLNLALILLLANEVGHADRLQILIEEAIKVVKQAD